MSYSLSVGLVFAGALIAVVLIFRHCDEETIDRLTHAVTHHRRR